MLKKQQWHHKILCNIGILIWLCLVSCICVYAAWLSSLMDPCSLSDICNSCHKLATCNKSLNGSNSACFCKRGYTGDGTTFCSGEYRHTIHTYITSYLQWSKSITSLVCSCLGSLDYFREPVVCDCWSESCVSNLNNFFSTITLLRHSWYVLWWFRTWKSCIL